MKTYMWASSFEGEYDATNIFRQMKCGSQTLEINAKFIK